MNFRMIWMGPDDGPNGPRSAISEHRSLAAEYVQCGTAMARKHLQNGRVRLTPLANFSARIVRDLILEDDAESRRDFGIEAELGGQKFSFVVAAREFGGMGWVLRHLGPQAIIYPGQQQHARAAIQALSGPVRKERLFLHLGWVQSGTDWVYLQAQSAIGAQGLRCDMPAQTPAALEGYQMQTAANSDELVIAVQASLKFLSLAPDRITLPLLAGVYRAALGKVDFSVFLTGRSGTFKTALAALCQQHFGAQMDASHLPANFNSTPNALEVLAYSAKDTLLVVDDFVPSGRSDSGLQSVAERLFRSAGNHQGRSRMGSSGRMSAPRPPRALVLASGEEVPQGQSVRARLLIVEVHPGDVDRTTLSECQLAAQEGRWAVSMGGFVGWIASRYQDFQERLQTRVAEIRSLGQGHAIHARLPTAIAELRAGWEIFLDFALESGAIGREEQVNLAKRSERAFGELEVMQIPYHQASDPALRFLSLLRGALASGRAHILDRLGKTPETPAIWGCCLQSGDWIPQGSCIGWVAGSDLFLEPAASYQVAQAMAGSERIAVGEQTLRQRLRAGGFLASIDVGRQMLVVRRTLQGCPRQVLHLKTSSLYE